jgi:polysaccharide pyruvyl transferase WcaK-like protein
VLHLLDGLDLAVAMRFHASVFAFARGLPALGIDYSVGGRGKVGDLYRDRGLENRVERVDRFTAEWMVPRLAALAAAADGRAAADQGTSSR